MAMCIAPFKKVKWLHDSDISKGPFGNCWSVPGNAVFLLSGAPERGGSRAGFLTEGAGKVVAVGEAGGLGDLFD